MSEPADSYHVVVSTELRALYGLATEVFSANLHSFEGIQYRLQADIYIEIVEQEVLHFIQI